MLRYQNNLTNSLGVPVYQANVLVSTAGQSGTSTATLYGDEFGTSTLANPLTTDINGYFFFYQQGRFDLTFYGATIQTSTYADVALDDVPNENLAELTNYAAARANLGVSTGGGGTSSGALLAVNNLSDLSTVSAARANLGLGPLSTATNLVSGFLYAINNLSDLTTQSAARVNLGLGTSTGVFLALGNNLAEITAAGSAAQASARSNLGFSTGTGTSASLLVINNLSDLSTVAQARINLALGTSTGTVLSASRNLGDVNLVSGAASARANLGFGTGTATGTPLFAALNLSDIVSASSARANLNMGTSTGIVLAALNNLSDVVSASSARANLNMGTGTGIVLVALNNLSDVLSTLTAQSNLGLAIGTNVQAFNANYAVTTASESFTKAQRGTPVALTGSASQVIDFSAGNNFSLNIGVNTTFANPTNMQAGQSGCITITQTGTVSYTAAFSTAWWWAGTATGTLSTASAAVDALFYYTPTTTSVFASMNNQFAP